jgi:hypothetical protein
MGRFEIKSGSGERGSNPRPQLWEIRASVRFRPLGFDSEFENSAWVRDISAPGQRFPPAVGPRVGPRTPQRGRESRARGREPFRVRRQPIRWFESPLPHLPLHTGARTRIPSSIVSSSVRRDAPKRRVLHPGCCTRCCTKMVRCCTKTADQRSCGAADTQLARACIVGGCSQAHNARRQRTHRVSGRWRSRIEPKGTLVRMNSRLR